MNKRLLNLSAAGSMLNDAASSILNSSKFINNYPKDQDNPYIAGIDNTIIVFSEHIADIIANRL